MLTLRAVAKSAPRSLSRFTFASASRSSPILRTFPQARASWTPLARTAAASFSSSSRRYDGMTLEDSTTVQTFNMLQINQITMNSLQNSTLRSVLRQTFARPQNSRHSIFRTTSTPPHGNSTTRPVRKKYALPRLTATSTLKSPSP